ncbi:MAG: hypothetical protein WED34_12680 [Planctomycetales bacterium]
MHRKPKSPPAEAARPSTRANERRPACPVCGGRLVEIKHKLVCSRCRTICETCCDGGRTAGG